MVDFPIVDSHVHLWDPSRFRMPWIDDIPALRSAFDATDFTREAHGLSVESVVYVQVDVTPAYGMLETLWVLEQPAPVAGIVAWAPLEDGPPVRSYLDALAERRGAIKGVRRLLQSEPGADFLVSELFLTGLRLLPRYGLSFDICIRHDQLARAIDMVRACPETSFVLDHLAKPDVRGHLFDPWRAQLAELAELPNVLGCKVSGLVTEADHASWTPADLEPYVTHALRVFGEDRVMFGGDWPVVTLASTYERWVQTLDQLTARLSPEAKQKLWADNARRIYRL